MKKILHLSLLFCLFNITANAQCVIPNNSFENWSQQDFPLEFEDGSIINGSALLPDNYISLYKYAFGLFILAFGDSTDYANFENNTQDFIGLERSEDASDGNYAVKLYGNSSLDFSDIAGQNDCDEIPESFSVDVKHVGQGLDTFIITAMWDEGLNFGNDEDNLPNAAAAYLGGISEDGEYETITIPIEKLNNNPSDTFSIILFTTFENYEDSYFLFDNLRFNYSARTDGNISNASITVGPNPSHGDLSLKSNIQNGSKVSVFDVVGRLIISAEFDESINIDLSANPSGIYLIQVSDRKGNLVDTKKVVLLK